MKNIFKTFENSMLAATFAQAGDHETARTCLAAAKTARKKILLGTDAMDITPRALHHALSVCERNGASLEILHAPHDARKPKSDVLKERFMAAGILYEFVRGASRLEEEIIRYAGNRRDILLVMLGMADAGKTRHGNNAPDAHLLERFQCPVVLLEEPQPA